MLIERWKPLWMTADAAAGGDAGAAEGGDGAGAEGQSDAATAAPEPQEPVAGTDWRTAISDPKLREHAGRFASIEDVIRGNLDQRSKLSNAIIPPGENATPDEIQAYRAKLGVPESADKYEIALPEGLPEDVLPSERLDAFRAKAHELGMTPQQAQAIIDMYAGNIQQDMQAFEEQAEQATNQAVAELKKEWGGEYDANVSAAQRAIRALADDGIKEMMDKVRVDGIRIGDHPGMIKLFANIGRRIGEDGFQAQGMTEQEQQNARKQMDDLIGQKYDAADRQDRVRVRQLDQEIRQLSEKLGGGDLVGVNGRVA